MEEKKLTDQIVSALIHFLYNFFVYFIFIVPFDLWKKATIRLANQKDKGGLNISKITSLWPFLSFLKAFIRGFHALWRSIPTAFWLPALPELSPATPI